MSHQLFALALAAVVSTTVLYVPLSHAGDEHGQPEVAYYMSRLQYFTHKLGLAISAQNDALQRYYIHEIEEIVERLAEVENYKGIEVGKLIETLFEPTFERLEATAKEGTPHQVDAAYDNLLTACNSCHKAAHHGFIHIERRADNPYMQSFSPQK